MEVYGADAGEVVGEGEGAAFGEDFVVEECEGVGFVDEREGL